MYYLVFFILLCLTGFSLIFSAISPLGHSSFLVKIGLVAIAVMVSHFIAQFLESLLGGASPRVSEPQKATQLTEENQRFLFIQMLFVALGRVANADNQVCNNEKAFIEKVILRLALSVDYADMAREYFHVGVYEQSDFDASLANFSKQTQKKRGLQQIFFEILLELAGQSGRFTQREYVLLEKIRGLLQPNRYLDELLSASRPEVEAQSKQSNQSKQQKEDATKNQQQWDNKTRLAFRVLGLKPNVSGTDIKRRYRQLIKAHHPDRLIAEGMPEELIEQANQQAAKINKAYKQLRKALQF